MVIYVSLKETMTLSRGGRVTFALDEDDEFLSDRFDSVKVKKGYLGAREQKDSTTLSVGVGGKLDGSVRRGQEIVIVVGADSEDTDLPFKLIAVEKGNPDEKRYEYDEVAEIGEE